MKIACLSDRFGLLNYEFGKLINMVGKQKLVSERKHKYHFANQFVFPEKMVSYAKKNWEK